MTSVLRKRAPFPSSRQHAVKSTSADPAFHCIDIGEMTQLERHAVIFARIDALRPGQSLRLLYDHNPRQLRDHFDTRSEGLHEWLDMKAGALVWRVQITRPDTNSSVPPSDPCRSAALAPVGPSKDSP